MAVIIDTVRNSIVENLGGTHSLAKPENQFALKDVPSLEGKVAVITGGSDGIGYGCTHTLFASGIEKIFVISRTKSKLDASLTSLTKDVSQEATKKITWLPCDLSSWSSVTSVASTISSSTSRLDIPIADAACGIMTYDLAPNGVDRHMAVNHIGHVVLVSHLLPLMKKTASEGNKVRIVTLGSNAHQATPSSCKFESLEEMNQDLGPNGQYGRSKLAQMLYARYLSRCVTKENPNILVNTVHPGFVETKQSVEDIHEAYPIAGYAMSVGMKPFKKSIWDGCVSAVFAATKTEGSGEYICPPAVIEDGSAMYRDDELMERLMVLTKEIVLEKNREESVEKGCLMKFD